MSASLDGDPDDRALRDDNRRGFDDVGAPPVAPTRPELTDYRIVRVLGQSVRVHIHPGTEPGRVPLVLCNGIGASLEVLDPLVAALGGERDVVRFDVPGTGSSPAPAFPYRMTFMAMLVARMLGELGYRKFDLLGYSWGGALAQQIAVQFPRRCRRLVLVSTTSGAISVPGRPDALSKMLTPRRHRDSNYAAKIAGDLYGGVMRTDPTEAKKLLGEHTRAASGRGYLLQLWALSGWTSVPWLCRLRQRTLLLFGDDDPIIPPANGRLIAKLIPRSQLVEFEGGHLDLVARAEEFGVIIDSFLTEPAANRPSPLPREA